MRLNLSSASVYDFFEWKMALYHIGPGQYIQIRISNQFMTLRTVNILLELP